MSVRLLAAALVLFPLLVACDRGGRLGATRPPELDAAATPVATRGPDDGVPFSARAGELPPAAEPGRPRAHGNASAAPAPPTGAGGGRAR